MQAALAGGPRLVRELWDEGQKQGLSARTIERAKQDLSVRRERVVRQGRQENWWLLPGQSLPGAGRGGNAELEPWLAPLRERYPSPTPLVGE